MTFDYLQAVLSGEVRFCVIHGDNREILKAIPDKAIDHTITDPPYSEHCHSKSRAGANPKPLLDGNGHLTRCAIDREVDFGFPPISTEEREQMADEIARLTKRWALVFSDVESSHLWRSALSFDGQMDYVRTMAWEKIGATPQFTGDRPGVGFEAITLCHPKGKKRWNAGGKLGIYRHLTATERGGQKRTNNTREHTTQKPLDLMLELIADFTDPNDLILDMYAGSGTTGVAALRLGRRVILVEKQKKYAELCTERCAAELSMTDAKSARNGQMPMFGT